MDLTEISNSSTLVFSIAIVTLKYTRSQARRGEKPTRFKQTKQNNALFFAWLCLFPGKRQTVIVRKSNKDNEKAE